MDTSLSAQKSGGIMNSKRGKTSQIIFVVITVVLLLSMILSMVMFLFQN